MILGFLDRFKTAASRRLSRRLYSSSSEKAACKIDISQFPRLKQWDLVLERENFNYLKAKALESHKFDYLITLKVDLEDLIWNSKREVLRDIFQSHLLDRLIDDLGPNSTLWRSRKAAQSLLLRNKNLDLNLRERALETLRSYDRTAQVGDSPLKEGSLIYEAHLIQGFIQRKRKLRKLLILNLKLLFNQIKLIEQSRSLMLILRDQVLMLQEDSDSADILRRLAMFHWVSIIGKSFKSDPSLENVRVEIQPFRFWFNPEVSSEEFLCGLYLDCPSYLLKALPIEIDGYETQMEKGLSSFQEGVDGLGKYMAELRDLLPWESICLDKPSVVYQHHMEEFEEMLLNLVKPYEEDKDTTSQS